MLSEEQVEGTVCQPGDQTMPGSVALTTTTFDPAGAVGREAAGSERVKIGPRSNINTGSDNSLVALGAGEAIESETRRKRMS
jgi:hypothetical protein